MLVIFPISAPSSMRFFRRPFAVVREAGKRVLGMRHFDVQLIGGMVLHEGQIAEMKTGEGKTLVATLPSYLNALTGRGVHVVTVNDYLARRDAEWMGQVHRFLGLSVGLIQQDMRPDERRRNYGCDITYATNSELGFDYLRDNMAADISEVVQREFQYCVIDEVDSILIDEARTPLIISGQVERPQEKYQQAAQLALALERAAEIGKDGIDPEGDYEVDEKQRSCTLTDGFAKAEQVLAYRIYLTRRTHGPTTSPMPLKPKSFLSKMSTTSFAMVKRSSLMSSPDG